MAILCAWSKRFVIYRTFIMLQFKILRIHPSSDERYCFADQALNGRRTIRKHGLAVLGNSISPRRLVGWLLRQFRPSLHSCTTRMWASMWMFRRGHPITRNKTYSPNADFLSDLGLLVDVDLVKFDILVSLLLRKSLEHGGNDSAGSTPCCPKVNYDGFAAVNLLRSVTSTSQRDKGAIPTMDFHSSKEVIALTTMLDI